MVVAPTEGDRREAARIPLEIWVEESFGRDLYLHCSANISLGGMFLEHTIPHPVGTVVNLAFCLPGHREKVRVRGEIVNVPHGEPGRKQYGMGVKFVDLDEQAHKLIREFIGRGASPSR